MLLRNTYLVAIGFALAYTQYGCRGKTNSVETLEKGVTPTSIGSITVSQEVHMRSASHSGEDKPANSTSESAQVVSPTAANVTTDSDAQLATPNASSLPDSMTENSIIEAPLSPDGKLSNSSESVSSGSSVQPSSAAGIRGSSTISASEVNENVGAKKIRQHIPLGDA